MTTLNYTVRFRKTVLASLIGLCVSQSSFALEELSDAGLSETTGEGIAILPQNTYMVFRGAGANETSNQILTDRTKDTGYINYVPVGPLSKTAADTNKNGSVDSADRAVGKADIFLYGLALSKSDNDTNTRIASTDTAAAISSWGTAVNPWIFKVATENSVPNFSATNCSGAADPSCQVTYLALEAPLYEVGTKDSAGIDAYKLKLGLWTDIFVRDPNKINGAADQFNYGDSNGLIGTSTDASRANRLRLQGIWNNFSLNGSRLQLFQTLGGATSAGGMSPFYNDTLGFAGVVRLNSGDASNLRATITSNTPTSSVGAWVNRYSTQYTGAPSNNSPSADWLYRIRSQTTTVTSTGSWTAPTDSAMNNVLRLSTRESGTGQGNLVTPAINGGVAPTFDANEGLYLYNPNINLVLGSLYQPLVLSSDGKNFSLELARIPNKPEIYKKIYTDYSGTNNSYLGSTCNVYQCGTSVTLGGKTYQGSSATHSSISIGSTVYNVATNTLEAFKGNSTQDAVGISFGKLPTGTVGVTQTKNFYQLQNQERRAGSYTCSLIFTCYDTWQYRTATGWTSNAGSGLKFDSQGANWANIDSTSYYNPTVNNTGYTTTDAGNGTQFVVPAGTPLPDALYNGGRWSTTTPNADLNTYKLSSSQISSSISNNMGSAVIDGVLIQHLKLTTKGL
ncbi:hypothetical protein IIQ43_15015 [Acinetobacter oleivorans]|uniref:Uncharacterized protein n=1 Tax=Acinetobacter oleivorans TaxID=1148157 RepID=A0ABR9NMP9_9GAMM|nr:hypothetical protein [Acinetobacter oleivorans]MBE2165836.1 hypothetical protein [Acinetobacter oleivorans]